MNELRSAVVAVVREAAAAVHPWLERTCRVKPSRGVPAHVTILFPFVPATRIDETLVADLRALAGRYDRFPIELRTPGRFPGVLYLVPEPTSPFVALTEAFVAAYPQHAPYGGEFDQVIPHLTVAEGSDELLDPAEAEVRRRLPLSARVHELVLLEELDSLAGRWRCRARLPLR